MGQLFHFIRLSFTRYLALLLITCFFLSVTSHSSAAPPGKQHRTYSVAILKATHAIINYYVFLAVERQQLPAPVWIVYQHPKNDQKPDNTNFQPIRMRSLGFLSRQINV